MTRFDRTSSGDLVQQLLEVVQDQQQRRSVRVPLSLGTVQ